MKRTVIAATVFAAGTTLSAAAYAQDAHNHGTPKSGPEAGQGHDAHCCKPDPKDMKGMQGMSGHSHDHAQTAGKPAVKKPVRKPAADAGPTAK